MFRMPQKAPHNILNISELMKGNNIKYDGIIWNENNQRIK